MKTLTVQIIVILLEAASESPPPPPPNESGGNSKGFVSHNLAFENNQSSTCYHNTLQIISGLQNTLQNHRRVPVCRNKQFEMVYWKDFHNLKCFHRSMPKFYLLISP